MEEGHILLRLLAFDELNNPIICIDDNEIVYGIDNWDVQWVGQKLTIREGHRKILLEIVFQPPHTVIISKGRFLYNGVELILREDLLFCSNNSSSYSDCRIGGNYNAGLSFGHSSGRYSPMFLIQNLPRYDLDRKQARADLRRLLNQRRATNSS
jgi:trigger factor